MRNSIVCKVLFVAAMICGITKQNSIAQKLDKPTFYQLMKLGSKDDIDKELANLKDNQQGYAGALIIRKAGLPKAKDRLKTFKEGRNKLDAAIDADPDNTELRFIRLSIQERSPKIVGYKKDIQADKAFVIKHFAQLSPVVQDAVKDYAAKESKVLKTSDLN